MTSRFLCWAVVLSSVHVAISAPKCPKGGQSDSCPENPDPRFRSNSFNYHVDTCNLKWRDCSSTGALKPPAFCLFTSQRQPSGILATDWYTFSMQKNTFSSSPKAFTLHGLWPGSVNGRGGKDQPYGCENGEEFDEQLFTSFLDLFNMYWATDPKYGNTMECFILSEWMKHGTCAVIPGEDGTAFRISQELYYRTAIVLANEFNENDNFRNDLGLQGTMSVGCVQCAYFAATGWTDFSTSSVPRMSSTCVDQCVACDSSTCTAASLDSTVLLDPNNAPFPPSSNVVLESVGSRTDRPTAYQPEFFASPHPDDWQLFTGRRAARDMVDHPDWRAVMFHISAGDAGCPWCTYNRQHKCPGFKESVDTNSCQKPAAMFWADAREKGNVASMVALMKNTLPPRAKVTARPLTVKIRSHKIMKYVISNNINDKTYVAYMFRLPDGGFNSVSGSSYHKFESLTNLLNGANSSIRAIDDSTVYTSAGDFNLTLHEIIRLEMGSFRRASVHTIEPLTSGHPDHSALAYVMENVVARSAADGYELQLYYYEDYILGTHPAEINPYEDFILKLSINTVYYDVMKAAPYNYTADWLDNNIPHYYNYAQFMIKENCTRLYKAPSVKDKTEL